MGEHETPLHRVVESVMNAVRTKKGKGKPAVVEGVIKRVYPESKSLTPTVKETRIGRIVEGAKDVVREAKASGQHITTGMSEWAKNNKFKQLDPDPARALKLARQDLSVALKAGRVSAGNWIAREAVSVRCAEAAQALTVAALAPTEVRENPNFLFQTAAQLTASTDNSEAQPTIHAFVAEMNRMRGKDRFDLRSDEMTTMLTEKGMWARTTRSTPDTFNALVPGNNVDFSSLPDSAKHALRVLNGELDQARNEEDKYRILMAFSKQIEDIDTSGFTEQQQSVFHKFMRERVRLEAYFSPARGIDRNIFRRDFHIEPHGNGDFQSRGMTEDQVREIFEEPDGEGDAGIDKYIHRMMRRIFSSAREPRSPDLQEQTEYWEIEQLWRYTFGEEKAQAKLGSLREKWESEYRRNAINWHIVRGGTSNKELITKYLESIPPDTMQHEQGILWGPEAIAAYEQVMFEMGTEKRFTFDEGRRWFEEPSASVRGKTKLEAFGEKSLTGTEKDEAKVWQGKMGHGSYIIDKDAQYNANAFDKLATVHGKIEREYQAKRIDNPHLTEDAFFLAYAPDHTGEIDVLRDAWKELTLFKDPEVYVGQRLWNTEVLNAWQGFSPLQIRVMIKLESMLKAKGIQYLDKKTWKLARAVSAASRSEVGSLRTVSLSHQLLNMPGVLITPSGSNVMEDAWQEQLGRVENPEVFMRRFSLGGQNQGQEVWANLITSRLERKEVSVPDNKPDLIKALKRSRVLLGKNDYAPAQGEDESFSMRKARSLLLKSRRHYGIGFTEIPREPLATAMSIYEGTYWRFEPTVAKLDAEYGIDAAKHVGMGMRIALSDNPVEKQEYWTTIAKRTPSKLVQLMFTEQTDQALKDNNLIPGSPEWERFNRVLSVVEHKLQTVDANIRQDIDLGGVVNHGGRPDDFNRYFTNDIFKACGIKDSEIVRLRGVYFQVINQFENEFLNRGPVGDGGTYVEIWASNRMAITPSISDYDIKYTQWEQLPADHHFRRVVSDATGHLGVLETMIGFVTKPELCVQPDMKKVLEAEAMLQSSANSYGTKIDAERIMLTMDDAVVTYMESKDFYRWARVIPGAKTLLRQLAGIDTQKPWARLLARSVRPLLNTIANNPLLVRDPQERKIFKEILNTKDIREWPKKFAQLHLAPTIAAAGPGATTYDSFDVHKHYADLEHAGLVTENHKLLHKMKDKHKTRFPWRFLAIGQRYWWVPLVATIAVGVIIASKEQGLEGEGKSH